MKTSKELRETIGAACDKLTALAERAHDRDYSATEKAMVDACHREIAALEDDLARAEKNEGVIDRYDKPINSPHQRSSKEPGTRWVDAKTGKPVYALTNKQKLGDLPGSRQTNGLGVGDVVAHMITGRGDSGLRAALSGTGNEKGGFLVPDVLGNQFIDLARAKSCVLAAGAITIPMSSDIMTIAGLSSDVTYSTKVQNDAWTPVDLAFSAISLSSNTIGAVVEVSRELVEDAPNFSQIVEQALAKGLAAQIDYLALNGPNNSLIGLKTRTGLNADTFTAGSPTFEKVLDMIATLRGSNYEPTGWIISPTVANQYAKLVSGDAVNSAKNWLPAPADVAALGKYVSTNCGTNDIYVGSWDQFVFGVRQEPFIEATTTGGNAFVKHQWQVKISMRVTFNTLHPAAFGRILGS